MPRHPPCALCSLPNTNTQQKQQRHTLQKQTPTPNTPHHRHPLSTREPRLGTYQCGRCSRPLSRNQTTKTNSPCGQGSPPTRVLMPQNPNSVLETRPPTRTRRSTPIPPHAARGQVVLTRHGPDGPAFIDDSTIRTPPCPPDTRRQKLGACSLERR
jgi:hypothetical protein